MVTARQRYTYADLFDWPEDGDDQIYDLLGGELVVRNAPDLNHGVVLGALTALLVDAQRGGYGIFLADPHAAALDYPLHGGAARDVSHPDLFYIRAGREALWRGKRAMEGVPDLIVEARSPSTSGEHTPGGRQYDAYERNGVPYYWIVDPRARTMEQYTLAGAPYEAGGRFGAAVILREGDTLTCPLFPTIAVPVATVFQNVVYEEAPKPARPGPMRRLPRRSGRDVDRPADQR